MRLCLLKKNNKTRGKISGAIGVDLGVFVLGLVGPTPGSTPRVVCRSRSMKNGGFVGCRNSTFSRGPKSTESDEIIVLDHEGVIEDRSRGTIVLDHPPFSCRSSPIPGGIFRRLVGVQVQDLKSN